MSDKPIQAEIVRASDLNPGDRFTYIDCLIMADAVTHFHDSQCVRVDFHIAGVSQHAFWSETAFVARILPEPVEVREFWRAVHEDLDGERFGEECETREDAIGDGANLRVDSFEIEHVRETILIREEVKS